MSHGRNDTEYEARMVGKLRTLTDDEVIRMPRSAKVIKASRDDLARKTNVELIDMASKVDEIIATWKVVLPAHHHLRADLAAVIRDRKIGV